MGGFVSWVLALLLLFVEWSGGQTYTFYSESYVKSKLAQGKSFRAEKWNENLGFTKRIMVDGTWKATHLVKIVTPQGETIHRLARWLGDNHFSLDLSPDAIYVGEVPIAMRTLASNKGYKKDILNYVKGTPKSVVTNQALFTDVEAQTFGKDPEHRRATIQNYNGVPHDSEHSAGRWRETMVDKRTQVESPVDMATVYFVPTLRNQLGSDRMESGVMGKVATIKEIKKGQLIKFKDDPIKFFGGAHPATTTLNKEPTFDEQMIPLPPPPSTTPPPVHGASISTHQSEPSISELPVANENVVEPEKPQPTNAEKKKLKRQRQKERKRQLEESKNNKGEF